MVLGARLISTRRLVLGIVLLLAIDISLTSLYYVSPVARTSVSALNNDSVPSVQKEQQEDQRHTRESSSQEVGELVVAATSTGGEAAGRWCSVQELLDVAPKEKGEKKRCSEWSSENMLIPPFGCNCASYKSRYFCPSLGSDGYPIWEPYAVSQGTCKSVTRSEISEDGPFPPNFKVLFYGNSHVRQAFESVTCQFESKIDMKRVRFYRPYPEPRDGEAGFEYEALVPADTACRGCFDAMTPLKVTSLEEEMLEHQCIPDAEACKCWDNKSEYWFNNGATAHFYFAHKDVNKTVEDALPFHGSVPLSYYDVVFANTGNGPHMSSRSMLEVAEEVQAAGKQFIWLTTYKGGGDIDSDNFMTDEQRTRFSESGAGFARISRMVNGVKHLQKGEVEGTFDDEHYCLPGPPTEMALLLLKTAWATYLSG